MITVLQYIGLWKKPTERHSPTVAESVALERLLEEKKRLMDEIASVARRQSNSVGIIKAMKGAK